MKTVALFAGVAVAAALSQAAHAQSAADGRQIAAQRCQVCHGLDGIAVMPVAPNLAGENAIYLQTQLKAFRSGARVNEMMTVIAKDLTDADITAVSAWYESILVEATIPE